MSELPRRPLASADPVEAQFGRFYATQLRRVVGARLKAGDVMHAYQESMAHEKRAHSIGFRRLKALMQSLGHEHFYSNGSYYRDVGLIGEGESQLGCAPSLSFLQNAGTLDLLARLDAIAADLIELRTRIVEGAA